MSNVDFSRYSKRIVQYFWDPLPKNDDSTDAPIWCLGRRYETRPQDHADRGTSSDRAHISQPPLSVSSSSEASLAGDRSACSSGDNAEHLKEDVQSAVDIDGGWPAPFLDDFESKIWLTYRSNFPPIPKSVETKPATTMSFSERLKSQLGGQGGFTSDSGWGCMIRSGQSLLANALVVLKLGREWRRGSKVIEERHLLSLFADNPKAPFSIHRFVEHGASACGKHPGEWFGPSATARCIQALSNDYEDAGLRVYITGDGSDVYEDSFMKVAKSAEGVFRPTLVLVGIRLGIDRVTPVYWEALKTTLQLPQSIGIAGGRPSSSHYFVGTQDQYLFYLDPHQTRPALPLRDNMNDYDDEDIDSCHTRRLRRVHIKEMDPSMLIAFLVRDEADWHVWRKSLAESPGKPVIHIADQESAFHGQGAEREGAIDEVETFDDDDGDGTE